MGMSNSAHVLAMSFVKMSVAQSENSTSTAATLTTFAALRIVAALTSDSETPPILPALTYSFMASSVVSMGTFGSNLAHSNKSRNFFPSSTFKHASMLRLTFSGVPFGALFGLARPPGLKPPLMDSTTLLASSGYCVK